VALFSIAKGRAPTQLTLTGAAVGFTSGALGACVYSLHCPELEPAFVALWYTLGISVPVGFGSIFGPRILRW
jgi:hypothetical protein